jgi:hypothetical protein
MTDKELEEAFELAEETLHMNERDTFEYKLAAALLEVLKRNRPEETNI